MIINKETLNTLIENLGAETVSELVDLYIETTPEVIDNIIKYNAEGDYENIRFWGHRLKGSSATLGFEDISTKAKEIEMAGKSSNSISIDIKDELNNLFNDVKNSLSSDFPDIK